MRIISKNLIEKLFWVGIFGLAMGFLEAIVVVYLRDIYYPAGFGFPMSPVSPQMYMVELVREVATILMLLALGFLVGKNGIQKMAYFLISFAAWDIIYYIALKLFLDWPPSLLTWDILFLIPLPWLGPVLAPVIVSLTMIWLGTSLLLLEEANGQVFLKTEDWLLLLFGTGLIFASFVLNYSALIVQGNYLSKFLTLSQNHEFLKVVYAYTPEKFNWVMFGVGEIIVFSGSIRLLIRYRKVIQYTGKELRTQLHDIRHHLFNSHLQR
ncbi:MAG: hypothetical protein Q7J65_05995 [Candidatus Marinimicrobia bacterium]|nr:hypothetical protein [Candidatus Neomarinimicrobiota bacterium]